MRQKTRLGLKRYGANSESDEATINQRSFVKAIVKYVLTANNPITIENDFEREKRIFLNYWKANQIKSRRMAIQRHYTNTVGLNFSASSRSHFLLSCKTAEASQYQRWKSS